MPQPRKVARNRFYFSKLLYRCPQCQGRKFPEAAPTVFNAPVVPEVGVCHKCQFQLQAGETRCRRCGLRVEAPLKHGYVYVLVHPHMHGLVKIGKTQRLPSERTSELSQHTGVPGDFILAYEREVTDCHVVEQLVHEYLKVHRLQDKEFFQVSLQQAIDAVIQTSTAYWVRNGSI